MNNTPKPEQFTFSFPPDDLRLFRQRCAAKRTSPADVITRAIYVFLAEDGAAPIGRLKVRHSERLVLDLATKPFTISSMIASSGMSKITVTNAVKSLIRAGLMEEAGAVKTVTAYATSYRRTPVGDIWVLEQTEAVPPGERTIMQHRSAVKAFLTREGLSLQEANKALEDEELIAHMGDYKMDYSLEYWRQWLDCRRENILEADGQPPE